MAKIGQKSKVPSYFRKDGKEQNLTDDYGPRIHPLPPYKQDFHTGGDYSSASGTPLVAPCNGVVTLAKLYTTGYGGRVLIYSEIANVTLFITHMEKLSVATGQLVRKGQLIGLSGGAKTDKYAGNSTAAHLHIGVAKGRVSSIPGKDDKNFYDPETFDWSSLQPKPTPTPNGKATIKAGAKYVSKSALANGKAVSPRYIGVPLDYVLNRVADKPSWVYFPSIKSYVDKAQVTLGGEVAPAKKSNEEIATEVKLGKWGNGAERKKRLTDAGYDYDAVQAIVNGSVKPTPVPKPTIKVGSKVKINKGAYYQGAAKGKKVSTYALSITCTVDKINGANARLQPINSWVAIKDLKAA